MDIRLRRHIRRKHNTHRKHSIQEIHIVAIEASTASSSLELWRKRRVLRFDIFEMVFERVLVRDGFQGMGVMDFMICKDILGLGIEDWEMESGI